MADRCTLHWNHLDEFTAWLEEHGWKVVPSPPGNGFEVLRARHPEQHHPVIFYSRLATANERHGRDVEIPTPAARALCMPADSRRAGMAQHLTSYGRGPGLVRRFLRDRKTKLVPAMEVPTNG